MTRQEAIKATGGLANTTKMPCYSWGIPTEHCYMGAKLSKVKGSICSICYASKGMFVFPVVRAAYQRRYEAYGSPIWVDAMVELIGNEPYFRWFCSGDLQSRAMLEDIVAVCRKTPGTQHWLPTRERWIVDSVETDLRADGKRYPRNLCIRISATMIDGRRPNTSRPVSTSHTTPSAYPRAWICPVKGQRKSCDMCRRCWDRHTKHVSYEVH